MALQLDSFIAEARSKGFDQRHEVFEKAFKVMNDNNLQKIEEMAGTSFDVDWKCKDNVDAGTAGFIKQLILRETNLMMSQINKGSTCADNTTGGNDVGVAESIGTKIAEALEKKKKKTLLHVNLAVCPAFILLFSCLCVCFIIRVTNQDKIPSIDLRGLPCELWPSSASVDHMATELASFEEGQNMKFVNSSNKHFLPVWWLDRAKGEESGLLHTNIWSAAFLRWAIAAASNKMVSMPLSLAFHHLCLR